MKTKNLKFNYVNNSYNSSVFFQEIPDDYIKIDDLRNDKIKKEQYLKYLYNYVNESDYFIIDTSDDKFQNLFSKLKSEKYDMLHIKYWYNYVSKYLFEIKTLVDKNILKEYLKEYLLDDFINNKFKIRSVMYKWSFDSYSKERIIFIKDDNVNAIWYKHDGMIYEYVEQKDREIKKIDFQRYSCQKKELYSCFDSGVSMEHIESGSLDENDIKKLDNLVNLLYKVIDDSDKVFFNTTNYKFIDNYVKNLKSEYYDFISNSGYLFNSRYIFYISDENSKDFVKSNLKFNLIDYDENMVEINIDRSYIANDRNFLVNDCMIFIKDGYINFIFDLCGGIISDYMGYKKLLR